MATLELNGQRLDELLLADLTDRQRNAVTHDRGPLLIIAGAGTGKTTVITRRIAWLITTKRARPEEILALTFTEKSSAEMQERVDLLVPYGYLDTWISTFHAFGDRLLREHATLLGLSPQVRVLSKPEQIMFLQQHLFELPLGRFRPLQDPTRYLGALATVIGRAKDEAVNVEEFLRVAESLETHSRAHPDDPSLQQEAAQVRELAGCYETYQRLLHETGVLDFGDQVLGTIELLTRHPDVLADYRQRFRYILVDEFQDTNFAQYILLQLLAPPEANITVVCDDDQSIYKWRGAAISNVLKFLEHYHHVARVVLTENFRSNQAILDAAYRLIRHNDPDRLEVTEHIDKRLTAMVPAEPHEPSLMVFDTVSSEADWIAQRIHDDLEAKKRRPADFAILVRSNKDADPFLRALNVCGLPWRFSGTTALFIKEEAKLLRSCLKMLADPEDNLSWYHVASSALYACPMEDLVKCLAQARRTNRSLRAAFERVIAGDPDQLQLTEDGQRIVATILTDARRLLDLSTTLSPGQLLYRWLGDRGWLKRLAAAEHAEDAEQLQQVARFFDHLHRFEQLVGNRLPELIHSLELFETWGDGASGESDPALEDRVNILTLHKAKGLEFPVVFLVGLVQGRFPTPQRRDTIELPEPLIKDILPEGEYHLQEERRLCYVGMTRAKEELYLTAAYHYGGKSVRKISRFVAEALNLSTPSPPPLQPTEFERIARSRPPIPVASPQTAIRLPEPLRLNPHGADDYLTCPFKFRYSHVLKLPIMRHHLVIYGAALHKAIELFFTAQLRGQTTTEAELVRAFEDAWSSEGFLSREHETQRLQRGREVLRRFFAQQQRHPEQPSLIEEKFTIRLDDFLITGRWDRIDGQGADAVIIDYKSSEVTEQDEADKRVRKSLQMGVYALAWQILHGHAPKRLELRFLETGVIGSAELTDQDLEAVKERLREAASRIRALDFHPEPSEKSCRWCAYQTICPSAIVSSS